MNHFLLFDLLAAAFPLSLFFTSFDLEAFLFCLEPLSADLLDLDLFDCDLPDLDLDFLDLEAESDGLVNFFSFF